MTLSFSFGFLSNPFFQVGALLAIILLAGLLFIMSRRGSRLPGQHEGGLFRTMALFLMMIYTTFAILLFMILIFNWFLPFYVAIPPSLTFSNAIFAFMMFNLIAIFTVILFYGRIRGRRI